MISAAELVGKALCDVVLTAMAWRDAGIDFEIELPDTKLAGSRVARLSCRWLHSTKVTLDLSKNPGPPLTWNGEVTRRAGGGFRLELDFASSGAISVECERLELHGRS